MPLLRQQDFIRPNTEHDYYVHGNDHVIKRPGSRLFGQRQFKNKNYDEEGGILSNTGMLILAALFLLALGLGVFGR